MEKRYLGNKAHYRLAAAREGNINKQTKKDAAMLKKSKKMNQRLAPRKRETPPEKVAEICKLRSEEKSHAEIASITEIPLSTIGCILRKHWSPPPLFPNKIRNRTPPAPPQLQIKPNPSPKPAQSSTDSNYCFFFFLNDPGQKIVEFVQTDEFKRFLRKRIIETKDLQLLATALRSYEENKKMRGGREGLITLELIQAFPECFDANDILKLEGLSAENITEEIAHEILEKNDIEKLMPEVIKALLEKIPFEKKISSQFKGVTDYFIKHSDLDTRLTIFLNKKSVFDLGAMIQYFNTIPLEKLKPGINEDNILFFQEQIVKAEDKDLLIILCRKLMHKE